MILMIQQILNKLIKKKEKYIFQFLFFRIIQFGFFVVNMHE
jgi:hypothetical protein